MGGLILITTLDHTQIQHVEGLPFLTPLHIIPCFNMVTLEFSVLSNEGAFYSVQEISLKTHSVFVEFPQLVEEILTLCSKQLTFVCSWDDPVITASIFRLYIRILTGKYAAKKFSGIVKRQI